MPVAVVATVDISAILAALVQAKASPKQLGAAAAALARAVLGVASDEETSDEVTERLRHIKPVLSARVRAGAAGVAPSVSGRERAARNVSEHNILGAGADAVKQACRAPQAAQRAGRKRAAVQAPPGPGDTDSTGVGESSEGDKELKDGNNEQLTADHEYLLTVVATFPSTSVGCQVASRAWAQWKPKENILKDEQTNATKIIRLTKVKDAAAKISNKDADLAMEVKNQDVQDIVYSDRSGVQAELDGTKEYLNEIEKKWRHMARKKMRPIIFLSNLEGYDC